MVRSQAELGGKRGRETVRERETGLRKDWLRDRTEGGGRSHWVAVIS